MLQTAAAQKDTTRLNSIDAMRGLVIVIMALDHVRDFFSYTAYRVTDLTQASAMLFTTRWITHLCAPTFVFLSGISIYLYCKKIGDLKRTSIFLFTRGLWLILVEIFIISFILTWSYQMTLLTVFWAIGCSMILLAALIWLPGWLQLLLALAMIIGHNALPPLGPVSGDNMLPALLHNSPFFIAKPPVLVAYAIVPWVGVMLLGYCIGSWFTYPPQKRNRLLLLSGLIALIVFAALRYSNVYGDPSPWIVQERGSIYTLLSFLNVTKSPPSLLFLSVTLGIACLLIVLLEKLTPRLQRFFVVYGRVPLFFFVLHLAVISVSSCLWTKLSFGKATNLSFTPAKDWPAGYEPNLCRAYLVWILLIGLLYFPCRWYGQYKAKSGNRLMSYL
jgi:uncharacterized membrane protein